MLFICLLFFFFKQKTSYELRISDWSSDVCSSDLRTRRPTCAPRRTGSSRRFSRTLRASPASTRLAVTPSSSSSCPMCRSWLHRSEEHTSELQSLMRISYAVFCLKKKTKSIKHQYSIHTHDHTNTITS